MVRRRRIAKSTRTTRTTKRKCGRRRCGRTTRGAYPIPTRFACSAMRGPATSVITTNSSYGWSKQQVDDQQSSGLGFGPRPFRTG